MRLSGTRGCVFLAAMACTLPVLLAQESGGVKSFPSYQDAADTLVAAAAGNDVTEMKLLLGPDAESLMSSGDARADEDARGTFVRNYVRSHGYTRQGADKVILIVGPSAWPLPIPIVKDRGGWRFDTAEGEKELSYRRIGSNELDAIQVCRALYKAQKEYAATGHNGNPPGAYAQRIVSAPGTQNGLYWETREGEPESPAGTLVADAASEGDAAEHRKLVPFHGYLYRVLLAQGPTAPGGAKEFVKDGKMTRGFAILAYPAEYRSSGVMVFVVDSRGVVRQRDLGEGTGNAVASMKTYDPDQSWTVVH